MLAVGSAPLVVQHLAHVDLAVTRHPASGQGAGIPRSAGGADAVRPMPYDVIGGLACDKAGGLDGSSGEVGMTDEEPGVEDGDPNTGATASRAIDPGRLESPRGLGLVECRHSD
jgi:hypothetical protein